MVYIFTALYPEAEPLVRRFRMTREVGARPFQRFRDPDGRMLLVLTGPGMIAASTAVGAVLAGANAGADDLLISYGTAALIRGGEERAAVYQLHSLYNEDSRRRFYPDLYFDFGQLPEAAGISGMRLLRADGSQNGECRTESRFPSRDSAAFPGHEIVDREAHLDDETLLYDMESAAVYESGNLFLPPGSMIFLRTPSDSGDADQVTPELVRELCSRAVDEVGNVVEQCAEISAELSRNVSALDESALQAVDRLSEMLHASVSMRQELLQFARFYELNHIQWRDFEEKMREEKLLPVRDRRAGLRVLERFRRLLAL